MCFLVSLCILVKLSASCHVMTCFFVDVVHFSLITTLFVLFHLIHYWQLFCVCVECSCVCFLASLCILVRLSAPCNIATCFFVDVVHFSLITTLFVLFHFIHYWQLICVCVECLCVCFLVSLCILARLSASCHIATCFFVDVVDFSLVTTLFVLFH